jgi:hypothetical protein
MKRGGTLVLYLVLTWLFGGAWGLLVGVLIAAPTVLLRLRPAVAWVLSLACLALAPFVLMVEGLPSSHIAGPTFGTTHMGAHALVGISLAAAGWAGVLQLSGERVGAPREWRLMDLLRAHRPAPDAEGEDEEGEGREAPAEA